MNYSLSRTCRALVVLLILVGVTGCGGTKVLKESQPLLLNQALAAAADDAVEVSLNWVIVRNGPGSWARNADWDEYLVNVTNRTDRPVTLANMAVIDSLDTRIDPQTKRKSLVKQSKKTARRYKETGLKVRAGTGAGTMLVAGAAVTAIGVGSASVVAATSALGGAGAAAGSGAAVAGGLLLIGPALAVGGIVRGINNSKVSKMIVERQTVLPKVVAPGEQLTMSIFFPLAPSPRQVEFRYTDAVGEHLVVLDTQSALQGLHITEEE